MPGVSYTKPSPTDKPPRLDGDDLYSWAMMIAQEQHLLQAKQALAIQYLQSRGYVPGEHMLTNDGYIVSAESPARVQSVPAVPSPAPSLPDNGTEDRGDHRVAVPRGQR